MDDNIKDAYISFTLALVGGISFGAKFGAAVGIGVVCVLLILARMAR